MVVLDIFSSVSTWKLRLSLRLACASLSSGRTCFVLRFAQSADLFKLEI